MTAIAPLESIHKKGLFGNHFKKTEKELIKISEIKNFSIIQIVQYKKSQIKIGDIVFDGVKFPLQSPTVLNNKDTRILWSAPRTWLVISNKDKITDNLKKFFDEKNFAVTDISHSRAIIQIEGKQTKEILKKGSPFNYNEFKKNQTIGTVYHGINIVVDYISDEPNIFNLICLRSFGETFYHHVTDSTLEYGYIGL